MSLYLGMDGGQSSTTALIGDERGRVIGYGRGGPCNHVSGPESRARFISAVQTCLREACGEAGLDARVHFGGACLGFSGGPADKEDLIRAMVSADWLLVTHDAWIALSGATGGTPGVITIAGTGSIAFGRNAGGRTARAGGWGYIFGDEGGGFDLARQALRAALRHEEGWGVPTSLSAKLLEATGASNCNELMHRFYSPEFPRPAIAALSKLVDEAAREGDAVASNLLSSAAQELAILAGAVRRQLFHSVEPVQVARIGGVFQSAPLLERFRTLVEMDGSATVIAPRYGPAAGALIEAYGPAGIGRELSNVPGNEK